MSTKSGPVRWLEPAEERAWRALRRVTVAVRAGTAHDLAAIGLSEADYEVLSTLSEQPAQTSTLGVQADKMGWSRSRLSRHAEPDGGARAAAPRTRPGRRSRLPPRADRPGAGRPPGRRADPRRVGTAAPHRPARPTGPRRPRTDRRSTGAAPGRPRPRRTTARTALPGVTSRFPRAVPPGHCPSSARRGRRPARIRHGSARRCGSGPRSGSGRGASASGGRPSGGRRSRAGARCGAAAGRAAWSGCGTRTAAPRRRRPALPAPRRAPARTSAGTGRCWSPRAGTRSSCGSSSHEPQENAV